MDIAYMSKKIEMVVKAVAIKKLDMSSDKLSLKVRLEPTIYDKLPAFVHSHIKLEANGLSVNNKPATVNEYAIPASHWLCTLCGAVTPDTQLQCARCSTVRMIETFPNVLDNPAGTTEGEIKFLRQRRQLEKQLICGRDLLTSQVIDMDDCWYLISTEWINQWKAFIFNKPCKSSRVSSNPAVGVLPPGPVSNYSLFLKDKQTLKDNLQKVSLAWLLNMG